MGTSKNLAIYGLLASLCFGATNGYSQARFAERISEIKKEIAALPADTTGTIVMLGDSITQGFFNKDYMPEKINGLEVVNEGISGDQIDKPTSGTGVVTRLDLVKQAKPAIVFVLIGINDMWGGKEDPKSVIPQYEDMVDKLKSAVPDARIVLQSILPTSKKNAYLNEGVDLANNRIQELAKENDLVWLDLHPIMEDEKGELKDAYTGDGVHLTPEAYAAWLKKLNEVSAELLNK